MEFDGQEEEMGEQQGTANYDSLTNSTKSKLTIGGEAAATTPRKPSERSRYRECLKNHAISIGGHAVDGCGEFMAAGDEGTLDALKCAACNCHRNFHRKETEGAENSSAATFHHQFSHYYRTPPSGYLHMTAPHHHHHHHRPPLALPSTSGGGGSEQEDVSNNPSSSGGGGDGGGGSGSTGKKRFRTKFTQEQKEKMLGFAETLGWRIQKHDEATVQQFCAETNVKRHVLKVWMHNNKHTLAKKP
ncbi:ZF-HD homeobox protein, Cys/His-rich dimerization domain [Dillenia turbinata]|uniref:ZF-HD homeobox protein, Cys/His-rich dimerization domain n=1 Tax=Dillenia turbinata TaxID=194707 RepID=A0AAN8ZER1_9MAGN